MTEIVKTMKLHIHVQDSDIRSVEHLTEQYRLACNFVSQYIFDHNFPMSSVTLSNKLYQTIRSDFGLKSQLTQSAIRTVTARYDSIRTQMKRKPYKFKDIFTSKWYRVYRTLDWLQKPVLFSRPQADLVRNRDYSFVTDKKSDTTYLSLNTLDGRIKATFDVPPCFKDYFDGTWSFGTGKIVSLKNEWYFHIPMTKKDDVVFDKESIKHVVGIDRGLRYLMTTYDEKDETSFYSGEAVRKKRESFNKVRAELQSKGTKSAKRALKRLSGRENRWMSNVNHCLSKTLVDKYGSNTLFVMEDLSDVSFDENLERRSDQQRNELRSWSFYQLEQYLTYKAEAIGSQILKISPEYTSQRCPKCGRIHKANRDHDKHLYTCDCCGYHANDDQVGAMNIQLLGTLWISGNENPKFKLSEQEKPLALTN